MDVPTLRVVLFCIAQRATNNRNDTERRIWRSHAERGNENGSEVDEKCACTFSALAGTTRMSAGIRHASCCRKWESSSTPGLRSFVLPTALRHANCTSF